MTRRRLTLAMLLLCASSALGCTRATAPECVVMSRAANLVCVNGTVRHFAFEGGFWAIRGDDGITYDPSTGIPEDFRREGLPVQVEARLLEGGGIHQAGPIIEIVSLRVR
jgi:hypothetical protein